MFASNTESLRRSFSSFNIFGNSEKETLANENPRVTHGTRKHRMTSAMEVDTEMPDHMPSDVSRNTPVKLKQRENRYRSESAVNFPLDFPPSLSKDSLSTADATPMSFSQQHAPNQNRFSLQTSANIDTHEVKTAINASTLSSVFSPHKVLSYVQVLFNIILLLVRRSPNAHYARISSLVQSTDINLGDRNFC